MGCGPGLGGAAAAVHPGARRHAGGPHPQRDRCLTLLPAHTSIIFIPGDLGPVLQCVQRGWVGVSGQELGEGDTMTLVTAMEERVEEVHLGSWGTATIHLPTLATYSGRGRWACAVFNEILGLVVFTIFGEGTLSAAPVFTGSHRLQCLLFCS